MTKSRDNFGEMLHKLAAFKRKHGHCNVPTNYRKDPQFGRWVAAQRFRKKIDGLSEANIKKLDRLSFVWSPSNQSWEKMFQLLTVFKEKHGHCNVPTHWSKNQSLATWLQKQRHQKKKRKLSSDRVERLEKLGLFWSTYRDRTEKVAYVRSKPSKIDFDPSEEKLYSLGKNLYVQYAGKGRKPRALRDFIACHNGEFPPYVPLPKGRTNFYLGERYLRENRTYWSGNGCLPEDVLDYVREHGRLPPYDW